MSGASRWSWVLVAGVAAAFGLLWALFGARAPEDASHVVGPAAALRYAAVVVPIAALTFLLHRRRRARGHPETTQRVVTDVVLVAAVVAPVLAGAVIVVSTIAECSTGAGC